jgi:hypothetical protein
VSCAGSVKEKQSVISFNVPEKKAAGDAKNVRWAASADMISFKLFLQSSFLVGPCSSARHDEGKNHADHSFIHARTHARTHQ